VISVCIMIQLMLVGYIKSRRPLVYSPKDRLAEEVRRHRNPPIPESLSLYESLIPRMLASSARDKEPPMPEEGG